MNSAAVTSPHSTVFRKVLCTLLQAAAPHKCTVHELLMLFPCVGTKHPWNQKLVAVLAEVILQDVCKQM